MILRQALIACVFASAAWGQARGSLAVKQGLEKLQRLGSVLMVAAHPDDENTALLAYFAQGRHMRTGYLSLTRGEGGQNRIGPEQGELMGVIRTQELQAARRVDGAEQFFTRAIDFGFSKTADETLAKWGRENVLADVVWTIRKFQPDIIVTRFSGTPRDGHGHHQSSAILALEGFKAAADPNRFPEQLQYVKPWQAKRIFYNLITFTPQMAREAMAMPDKIEIDVGEYNPELGRSYDEIAGASRSLHRSQGMGSPERKGTAIQFLKLTAGEPAKSDAFDGIDTSWKRLQAGDAVGELLAGIARDFEISAPSKFVPRLLEVRAKLRAMPDATVPYSWAGWKLRDLDAVIAEAAGLWLDVSARTPIVSPGGTISLTVTALNRSRTPMQLTGFSLDSKAPQGPLEYNKPVVWKVDVAVPEKQAYTQPYWLVKPPSETMYQVDSQRMIGIPEANAFLMGRFRLLIGDSEIEMERPVIRRYVDDVRGELTRPVVVAPPVAVEFAEKAVIFPAAAAKPIEVRVKSISPKQSGTVSVEAPAGWMVSPKFRPFQFAEEGESAAFSFLVTPPKADSRSDLRAVARIGNLDVRQGIRVIEYEHIPPQTVFPDAKLAVARADVKLLSKNIGYVMGAGDDVPPALRQMGATVTLLSADDLASADLSKFDAIVTGVRAYNVRPDLEANQHRLMAYVAAGGTLLVQYHKIEVRGTVRMDRMGPYPMGVSFDRVTVEDAPMRPAKPDIALLQAPNHIDPKDYEGWVQERGAYFAKDFDPRYQTVWSMNDPGEPPSEGGTIFARVGKGMYIYSPLAWFRQLPAGVPGAYRIFANLLSAGQAAGGKAVK